jgi:hypothetical protein
MKKLAILMSLMMVVAFTASISLAAQKAAKVKTMTGEVVKVDADKGDFVLKVKNKNHTLKAEPKMLSGITPGEKVTVEESGKMVKSIKPAAAPAKTQAPAKTKTE